MWSILYEADGQIFQLGPFESEAAAMQAAKDAQIQHPGTWEDEEGNLDPGEFDVRDQNVYLIGPDHGLSNLTSTDLGVVEPHPAQAAQPAITDNWEE